MTKRWGPGTAFTRGDSTDAAQRNLLDAMRRSAANEIERADEGSLLDIGTVHVVHADGTVTVQLGGSNKFLHALQPLIGAGALAGKKVLVARVGVRGWFVVGTVREDTTDEEEAGTGGGGGGGGGETAIHTHASSTQGGKLDWDDIWTDALHSHQGSTEGGTLDHGLALTGLGDDDHAQYLNIARHDTVDRHTLGTVVPHDSHVNLSGVTSDQHHDKLHAMLDAAHHSYSGGAALDVFGLSGASTLALLTPSADVSGGETALLRSATGKLTLQDLATGQVSSHLIPSLVDTYDLGSSTKLWRKGWLSEMEALLFAENTITLLGGWFYVPKFAGTVAEDVDTSETSIDFGSDAVPPAMEENDFIIFRSSLAVEYMQLITHAGSGVWNVTRNLDGSGPNAWPQGSPYANLGYNGDGRIELNAYDTPRISMVRQGTSYNTQTEMARIGDLNGGWGYSAETWGVALGQYTGNWLTIDPTNGIIMRTDNVPRLRLAPGQVDIGDYLEPFGDFLVVGSSGIIGYGGGVMHFKIASSTGDIFLGELTHERLEWDPTNGLRIFDHGNNAVIAFDVSGNAAIQGSALVNGTVAANKLSVGDLGIFSGSDGLLLLGPGCSLKSDAWTSLRGQAAAITNAFQTMRGTFPGTQGIVMEPGTTNYCYNGAMRDANDDNCADVWSYITNVAGTPTVDVFAHPNATMGWLQFVNYTGVAGDSGAYLGYSYQTAVGSFAPGESATVSLDIRGAISGATMVLYVEAQDSGGGTLGSVSTPITLTAGLKHAYKTYASLPASTSRLRVIVYAVSIDNGDVVTYAFGALNIEKRGFPTTFCSGNLPWCSWGGTEYASVSTRTATTMQAPVAGNITAYRGSIVVWLRNLAWNTGGGVIFSAGDTNSEFDAYFDPAAGSIVYRINGTQRCSYGPGTLDKDHCLVFEWDAPGDDSWLYVDGELRSTGTMGGGEWSGGNYIGIGFHPTIGTEYNLCGVITEFAVFGDLLSAAEVAAIWNLKRPMMDHGATDEPGIYITDGKFRIASAYTGTRIEITPDEIAGYNGSTKQFYLQTSDGKAYAGGGTVRLDSNGVQVAAGTLYDPERCYKFYDIYGNMLSRYGAKRDTTSMFRETDISTFSEADFDSFSWLSATSPTNKLAATYMKAWHGQGTTDRSDIWVWMGTDGKSNIDLSTLWNSRMWIEDAGIYMPLPEESSSNMNVQVQEDYQITFLTSTRASKTDIQDFVADRQRFMQLRPVTYRSVTRPSERRYVGMIAEEVVDAYPILACRMRKNRVNRARIMAGEPDEPPEYALAGWDSNQMLSMAVSIIQQQEADLGALAARVAALEANC